MARPQNRTENSVSLFPFLAVLVCAMGALIFLLIVTTRRARAVAIAEAKQMQPAVPEVETTTVAPPVQSQIPTAEEVYEQPEVLPEPVKPRRMIVKQPDPDIPLKRTIDALTRELENSRKRASELARTQSLLNRRVNRTKTKLSKIEMLQNSSKNKQNEYEQLQEEKKRENRKLLDQLSTIKEQIKRTREKKLGEQSKYSMLPFDGQTGTTRRPILIECVGSRIRFLQEGITLHQDELDGFTLDANPLLAGANSLMQYWTNKGKQANAGKNGEPYLLLLVRPSGSVTYYAARKLLSGMSRRHGYELIEEDWQLELPKTDPEARRVCQAAIQRAMALPKRSAGTLVLAPRQGEAEGKTIRFHRESGSFEVIESESTNSDHKSRKGAGTDPRSTGSKQNSVSETARNGFPGRSVFTQTPIRSKQSRESMASQGSRKRNLDGTRGFGESISRSNNFQNRINSGNEENSFPKPITGSVPRREEQSGLGSLYDSTPPGSQFAGEYGRTSREGNPFANRNEFSPSTRNSQHHGKLTETGSQAASRSTGESLNSGHPEGTAQSFGTAGENGSGHASRKNNARSANGNGNQKTENADSRNTSTSGAGGQPSTHHQPLNSGSPFSPNLQFTQKKRKEKESIKVRNRRRRWGYSGLGSSIGFEREVAIRIQSDRIEIGRERKIPIRLQGLSDDALTDRVLDGIEQQARMWGKPPTSFYWVPKIRFQIDSSGLKQIERLKKPLQQAGLFWNVESLNQTAGRAKGVE